MSKGEEVAGSAQDVKTIEALVHERDQAWNRHDAHEVASLFAPDIDFVDINGSRFTGRDQYEQEIARLHATTAKGSVATTESIDVKFLAPDIAVARFRWRMTGWRTADETVYATSEPASWAVVEDLHSQSGNCFQSHSKSRAGF
jgi:uncharacterized protein (TIGR02246 family)